MCLKAKSYFANFPEHSRTMSISCHNSFAGSFSWVTLILWPAIIKWLLSARHKYGKIPWIESYLIRCARSKMLLGEFIWQIVTLQDSRFSSSSGLKLTERWACKVVCHRLSFSWELPLGPSPEHQTSYSAKPINTYFHYSLSLIFAAIASASSRYNLYKSLAGADAPKLSIPQNKPFLPMMRSQPNELAASMPTLSSLPPNKLSIYSFGCLKNSSKDGIDTVGPLFWALAQLFS